MQVFGFMARYGSAIHPSQPVLREGGREGEEMGREEGG